MLKETHQTSKTNKKLQVDLLAAPKRNISFLASIKRLFSANCLFLSFFHLIARLYELGELRTQLY